jgi:hypothetical protein
LIEEACAYKTRELSSVFRRGAARNDYATRASPSCGAIHRFSKEVFAKKMDAWVISAFTRVHSPSKTGVNALKDALLPAHAATESSL